MSVDVRVNGYCPLGCGETLELNISEGNVRCVFYDPETGTECPEPYAVSWLLDDPETEHIIEVRSADFTMKHPLRERIDDELFDCEAGVRLAGDLCPPPEGVYRMLKDRNGAWTFERLE